MPAKRVSEMRLLRSWKFLIALALALAFLSALFVYQQWRERDWINTIPAEYRDEFRRARANPRPPLTPEQIEEVRKFPDVEHEFWLEHLKAGRELPTAPPISEHCKIANCPEFPVGYHSYQFDGRWYYMPLVWSRMISHSQRYTENWTAPTFDWRESLDFESRDVRGRIIKRISFQGQSSALVSLEPFLTHYEADFYSSFDYVTAGLWLGNRADELARWNVTSVFDRWLESDGVASGSGLIDYDQNFWLVEQGLDQYRVHFHINLFSKEPIFQGRHAYLSCAYRCIIVPVELDGSLKPDLVVETALGNGGKPVFFVDYDEPGFGYSAIDPDVLAAQLAANEGYSFLPGKSDLLVEHVKALSRAISRAQTPDPAFTNYK
ncbi:MAG: hypothetical protein NW202_06830 [Nitrospira sp.]|nr:hypothetical protein [Nitrospira sp.]